MKKIVLIAAGLVLSTQIHAAPGCTNANLNGNYVMYQGAINKNQHNGRCEITVLNGALSGACHFGDTLDGNPNFDGPVYGTATIAPNCSSTMQINFKPNPANQAFVIESFFDLQFTPDKQSFIGRFINTFGVQGTTSGTRYSPLLPGSAN